MKETFAKVWLKLKAIGKEIYLFASSMVFLKNFGGVVALLSFLTFCTFWWMHCFTNHGESLQVHDYRNMLLEDAIEKAQSRSFEIVVNDSTFLPGREPGIVLDQTPAPLSRVKENRKIYLSITKTIPDKEYVPALVGGNDDLRNFTRKCEKLQFVTEVVGRRYSNRLEPNTILEVIYRNDTITDQLKEGYQVPVGDTIQLVVSQRGGGSVPIPELVCKRYDAAIFLIGNYNLNIGSVIEDATVSDRNSAYVWQQKPRYSANGQVRIGEQIDIYLTQRIPESCTGKSIENPDAPSSGSDGESFDEN